MIKYDKLKSVETEEKFFDFICPNCKSLGMRKGTFTIKPVGISWKPDNINNDDIDNIKLRREYNSLPKLRDAILLAFSESSDVNKLNIHCNCCNKPVPVYNKINHVDLRKWISNNFEYELREINSDENVMRKRRKHTRY